MSMKKNGYLWLLVLLVVVSSLLVINGSFNKSTTLSDLLKGSVTQEDSRQSFLLDSDYSSRHSSLSRNTVVNGFVCDEDISDRYGPNPITPVSSTTNSLCVSNDLYPGVALQLWDLESTTPDWQDDFIGEVQVNQGDQGCWTVIPNRKYSIDVYFCEEPTTDFVCTDSDAGIDYTTYGSVSTTLSGNTPWEDNCAGNILIERYCDSDNTAATIPFNCGNLGSDWSCSDGKCKQEESSVNPVIPGNGGSNGGYSGSSSGSSSGGSSGSSNNEETYNSCVETICASGNAYCKDSNGDIGVLIDDCISKEAICDSGACQEVISSSDNNDSNINYNDYSVDSGEGTTGGALLPTQEELDNSESRVTWLIIAGIVIAGLLTYILAFANKRPKKRIPSSLRRRGRR